MNIFKRGLIVSCQALQGEPLHGDNTMVKMALAGEMGGAVGFRLNGVEDIINVGKVSKLPRIGIIKRDYEGYEVFITPTYREVDELLVAKPEVIAVDCTFRDRPDFENAKQYIQYIKSNYNVCLMADISTYEEGIAAAEAGADIVATTLAGYTKYSYSSNIPNLDLVKKLSKNINVPIIAEGNIDTPTCAVEALKAGAYAVVVGGAITRPQLISKKFTDAINEYLD